MKLQQTKDYLLLIDEEAEIKEGWKGIAYKKDVAGTDIYKDGILIKSEKTEGLMIKHSYTTNTWYNDARPVIAYYPLTAEAKELDLPLLPKPFKEDI